MAQRRRAAMAFREAILQLEPLETAAIRAAVFKGFGAPMEILKVALVFQPLLM